MRVDLHMHTTASDGNYTPETLTRLVKEAGVDLFAISDHDCVDNIVETENLARSLGLGFVRATEISSNTGPIVGHVLAYRVDIHHAGLRRHIDTNRQLFADSQIESLRVVRSLGASFDLDAFEGYTYEPTRGGWKALNFLVDQGVVADADEFFRRFVRGATFKFFPTCPPTIDAIRVAREAGGVAVLAHPGESLKRLSADEREDLIRRWKDAGLQGLECYSPYHTAEDILWWKALANRLGMLVTAGSDNHGPFTPKRAFGQPRAMLDDLNLGPIL